MAFELHRVALSVDEPPEIRLPPQNETGQVLSPLPFDPLPDIEALDKTWKPLD
jgi:hypothetical protein